MLGSKIGKCNVRSVGQNLNLGRGEATTDQIHKNELGRSVALALDTTCEGQKVKLK
jgi:hypothetical protein